MKKTALILTAVLALAACGTAGPDSESTTTVAGPTSTSEAATTTTTTAVDSTTTTTPETSESTAGADESDAPTEGDLMSGATPEDLMANIIADVIERTGASQSDLTMVRNEAAIWNDGSLGCPQPGQSYTQALVNGYWVVIEYAGSNYDYRASSSGYFRICEGGGSPPSNPTG